MDIDATCMRCHRATVSTVLCRRDGSPFFDCGADRDVEREPARFEGYCLRCCGHNHG